MKKWQFFLGMSCVILALGFAIYAAFKSPGKSEPLQSGNLGNGVTTYQPKDTSIHTTVITDTIYVGIQKVKATIYYRDSIGGYGNMKWVEGTVSKNQTYSKYNGAMVKEVLSYWDNRGKEIENKYVLSATPLEDPKK